MASAAAKAAVAAATAAAVAAAVTAAAVAVAAAVTTVAAAGRGDIEQHGRDGGFSSRVRIIGLEALQDAVSNNAPAESEDSGNGNGAESNSTEKQNS